MWAILPPQIRFGAIIALALFAGSVIYNRIYDRGYQAAALVAEQEKTTLRAANEAAIAAARRSLKTDLAKLIFDKERLEQHVSELESQADADPAGDRHGISADSVRRIDSVR